MNPIRQLRWQARLTQQELAAAAGTSQSAIAAYESGAKSPTLRTMQKLAGSLGLEVAVDFIPCMTREDRRSLAFHRAIAERVERAGEPAIGQARRNLARLRQAHPHATELLERWRQWLDLPPSRLAANMLDPRPQAREMRQVSPFSGMLSARERAQILRRFRAEHGT